ncbi:TPA: hypothetical protein JG809_004837 [Vibrio parahaemolyticus]|uniref:hypothetical protein n=1 Tax=Vibrio TaxID=662 RepID=UPI001124AD8A|nr:MULTISPECIES: hypothetical protein [Vibrio]EJA7342751.1 hypothetical protein [Vibrio parahaemolyticus]MBY3751492.1 hypothetical protein [Vibrio parahaemolyticus]MBY3757770.1 hypothetical protein [Vibrio parahaemolyticus]MBY3762674.1 hypothetical protein [Vibrio parahaemolyticus]MBY3772462.1 hypothetical protein [Vibrio parahaemolyticus]
MDIAEIDKAIEETQQKLEELKIARKVLLQFKKTVEVHETEEKPVISTEDIDIDALLAPKPAAAKAGLREDVLEILPIFKDREFTATHVFAVLEKKGIAKDNKSFRSRLSTTVRKMCEEEELFEMVKEGKGSSPHIYRNFNGNEDMKNEQ